VSVGEKRARAAKVVQRMSKDGTNLSPVEIQGRNIATTFWGQAWCTHLESFSDYSNRLPRGRTYARSGSIIDLQIHEGQVSAMVQGSSLYKVDIQIKAVDQQKWKRICEGCSSELSTVLDLLQGRLSHPVIRTITDQKSGLFPLPEEITLQCSCQDWATMCKHVAASLYGVGARLDHDPALLFKLRQVDHLDLFTDVKITTAQNTAGASSQTFNDQDLSSLFGIEIDSETPESNSSNQTQSPAIIQIKKTKQSTKVQSKTAQMQRNEVKAEKKDPPAKKKSKTDVKMDAKTSSVTIKSREIDAKSVRKSSMNVQTVKSKKKTVTMPPKKKSI
jgi:uncharacterized Zn finger protein